MAEFFSKTPTNSELPAGVVSLEPTIPPADPAALPVAIEAALEMLETIQPLTVLVNDPQRHTASDQVLAVLAKSIDPKRIRLLIASGSHRASPAKQGKFVHALTGGLDFAEVAWHDSRSDKLVPIGPTGLWRGNPGLLADGGLLAIGSVEPHYFAGFTGAHKTATIGCAAYEDIQANHTPAVSPDCRPTQLSDNPVYEGIAQMVRALTAVREVVAINLVQVGRDILGAFTGGPLEALQAARSLAEKTFAHKIDQPADAIIAQLNPPLDETFYQADKGIKNNEWAVRDGGVIVLVAGCPGGIGQDEFVRLLTQAPTHAAAAASLAENGYKLGDHKAVRLRYLTDPATRGVRVYCVSAGLSGEDARTLGLIKADNVAAALAAGAIAPLTDRVYHLRDAGNCCLICPKFDSPAAAD